MSDTASGRDARKTTKPNTKVFTVRLPNDTLAGLRARAEREGVKLNRVMIELAEGYRRGVYRLPISRTATERVYPTVRPPAKAPASAAEPLEDSPAA